MNRVASVIVVTIAALVLPGPVLAQPGSGRFEAGVQVSSVKSGEFESVDAGVGGRIAWFPVALLGIESEVTVYPGNYPDTTAFSRGRTEGLFGATVGPTFGALRPFARVRSGFLAVGESPEPFACIRIFPPPIACELSSGRTLPSFDVGGGIQVFMPKGFFRIDAGDRLIKYPGPVFDSDNTIRTESFFGHDFRVTAGGGVRF